MAGEADEILRGLPFSQSVVVLLDTHSGHMLDTMLDSGDEGQSVSSGSS